jgi:hypothetical protein
MLRRSPLGIPQPSPVVIAGLDPAIQEVAARLDCRVKLGNDTEGNRRVGVSRWTWASSLVLAPPPARLRSPAAALAINPMPSGGEG